MHFQVLSNHMFVHSVTYKSNAADTNLFRNTARDMPTKELNP